MSPDLKMTIVVVAVFVLFALVAPIIAIKGKKGGSDKKDPEQK
jgi:hypothetical protein